jgi:Uncharacterized protein conserved in bacteria (DUF2188)
MAQSREMRLPLPHSGAMIARQDRQARGGTMSKVTYHIVEHDGGWAYKVDGVFSEAFPSHDLARKAAERAAREQHVPGETRTISWEDENGRWHEEVARGSDRPDTEVAG